MRTRNSDAFFKERCLTKNNRCVDRLEAYIKMQRDALMDLEGQAAEKVREGF